MGKLTIYSTETKKQIMELVYKDKIPVLTVSEKFSIPMPTIYGWMMRWEKYGEAEAFVGSGRQRSNDAEMTKLRRENQQLKMQIEILKKVAAYQAKLDAGKK